MTKKIKKLVTECICGVCAFGVLIGALRIRAENVLEYDPAYRPEKKLQADGWLWAMTPSGIVYNLYIPEETKREGKPSSIPLIVVFHGNGGKAGAKDRFGRLFSASDVQKSFGSSGAAVLALQSRVEYFSDPHAYARLIKNVVMEHKEIDKTRIAGYGFSQGAAFVQELAMYDPSLFKAVASGSSYYSASIGELFRASGVKFYCATSRNDKGIYEQGHTTGEILSVLCPDSRYVEYETRGHFYITPEDTSGRGSETFIEWLAGALE